MSEPQLSAQEKSPGPLINGTTWHAAYARGAAYSLLMYAFLAHVPTIILAIALAGHLGTIFVLTRWNQDGFPNETQKLKNSLNALILLFSFILTMVFAVLEISELAVEIWVFLVFLAVTLSTKYLQPTVYTGF
ncbi:hypothetical protein IDM48_01335 [Rothia amarae]|uniref:Uncharacterized protein n=1 Tax=Rothia amarae TaxID=169480 RepID=A0A7H2BKC8_9MICC|nr:hypothetical protein [Rothia amarae]QNV40124.1 hypothetical protein IDM48_01335 [Rothia amarae]